MKIQTPESNPRTTGSWKAGNIPSCSFPIGKTSLEKRPTYESSKKLDSIQTSGRQRVRTPRPGLRELIAGTRDLSIVFCGGPGRKWGRSNEAGSKLYRAGLQPLVPAVPCKPGAPPRAVMRTRFQRSLCLFEYSCEGRKPVSKQTWGGAPGVRARFQRSLCLFQYSCEGRGPVS